MLQLKGDMIKQIIKTNARRILLGLTGLVLAVSSVVSFTNIDTTLAQSIQDQINSLQNENAKYKNEISRLEDQAVSYEDAIAKLQAEITALQQRIDQNAKERQRLASEIKEAEEELAKQKTNSNYTKHMDEIKGLIQSLLVELNDLKNKKMNSPEKKKEIA